MRNARTIFKVLVWICASLAVPIIAVSIQVIELQPRKGFPQNLYDTTLGFLFLPGWPIILTCSFLGLLLLATIITGIIVLRSKEDEVPASASPGSTITTNTVRDNKGAASQIGSAGNAMIIQNSPGAIIHSPPPPPPPQTDTTILVAEQQKALLHRYLNSVIANNKDLNPTGIHRSQALLSVNVPLDEIFIHIRAVSDRPIFDIGIEQQKLQEEIEQMRHRSDLDPHEREEYIQGLRAAIWHSQLGEELLMARLGKDVKIEEVLQRLTPARPAAVLLGSPGSGKSTTMRWLALHMARASCLADYQLPQDLAPVQLPLFLTIGDYAKAITAPPSGSHQITSVKEFFFHEWQKLSPDLPALLEDALLEGHCLLLFDGLDEVASDALRSRVRKDLYDFISAYLPEQDNPQSYNRVLITSRIVGYEPGPFAPFAQYTLLDLDDKQIQQFLTTWCPSVESYQARSQQGMKEELTPQQIQRVQQEGQSQRDRLLEALQHNPGIRRLAVNPLMLTILALIQKSGRRLPHRRIELYQTVTLTLLNNWNQFRGGVIFSPEESDLAEEVLSEFAYRLHSRDLPLTEKDVFAVTRQTMARYYHKIPEQIQRSAVETFIDTLRSSSSLFVERGQGLYGFLHRTFQEYYVMRYLVDTHHFPFVDQHLTPDEDLKAFVEQKCHTSTWHEPLLLLIAYKSEQKDRKERQQATALIQTILAARESYDAILQRHLLLAASALADCNSWYIDIPLQLEVANQLFDIYGDLYGAGRYTELQQDIEKIALLWLRGQPQGGSQQPPLLETWHAALCDHTKAQRQYGAAKLLAFIAHNLPTCPATVLHILLPPLLHLAGVQEWYRQELTCPPEIQSRLFITSARPSTSGIEDCALVTLRLLDTHGPAGWLHSDWLRWNEEQPDLLQRLTQHGLELDYLLTPAALPTKRDASDWNTWLETGKAWQSLAQHDPGASQTRLLQASNIACYPQAFLFKRLLIHEDAKPSFSWQEVWYRFLHQEMQQGYAATYLPCLFLYLLLTCDKPHLQQRLASDLLAALVTERTQIQALKALAILCLLDVRDVQSVQSLKSMQSMQVVLDVKSALDVQDILDIQDILNVQNVQALLNIDVVINALSLRNAKDAEYARNVISGLLLRFARDVRSFLDKQDMLGVKDILGEGDILGMLNQEQLLRILRDILLNVHEGVIAPALLAIYGILIYFGDTPTQLTQQVQRAITMLKHQTISAEQRQLIRVIQRRLSGVQTAHLTSRPLPSGTPDQCILHLHALQQQQPVLNRTNCEEIMTACTDTRETTKETWEKLNPDQPHWGDNGGSVGEFAWQMLSHAWNMDKAAHQTIVQTLDDDNPLICAAAALLLQRGKDLTAETKQRAGMTIMRILADEERSSRVFNPPSYYYSERRLDDVLFETLRVLAEGSN
jgi:hypothetical protein